MRYIWDDKKDVLLKATRGIGFQDVVRAIEGGVMYYIDNNDTIGYEHQQMLVVYINNYPYKVPYIQKDNVRFLITIYPSRKYKSLFFT